VRVDAGEYLHGLHDVSVVNVSAGDLLTYDGEKWVNGYNISDYITVSEVENISGNLQSQITSNDEDIQTIVEGMSGAYALTGLEYDNLPGISFNNISRTFTVSGNHNVWFRGTRFEKTTTDIVIPDVTGTYFIYYDSTGTLVYSPSPWSLLNEAPVADGLLMGCSVTGQVQPSLSQFYGAVEKEFYNGLNLNIIENPDVSFLANQGVLMFNAALTTEMNKAGSHMEIWEPLVKYLFEEIINHLGVPIVFLGKEAAKYKKYTGIFTHVFELSHPASASYAGSEWDTEGTFLKINRLLEENNGFSVQWLDLGMPF
jgi:uracil-DNA glycosylase